MTTNRRPLIFLDVDGVLNSVQWQIALHERGEDRDMRPDDLICPEMMERLNRVIEATEADVIVSSAWRTGRRVAELQAIFERHAFRGRITGKTGHGFNSERGKQILHWLELTGNEDATFVVIDDDQSDLGCVVDNLVKIDGEIGLTDEDVNAAISILRQTGSSNHE